MNILSISVLAVVTVIICVMLKPKNAEISVMLGISCSVIILIGVLTQVSAIVTTINQIIASSGISIDYIVILLKESADCKAFDVVGFFIIVLFHHCIEHAD